MKHDRWKLHLAVAAVAIAAMTMALTPAVADPVPDTEEYPDVAFLARNDVPFDAQTAASMAAQLGAPMFITNPGALSDAAANGISDLNPDVIIVAGGEFAISEDVANAAAAECDPDCTIDRRFGAGRDQTAAALAEIAADYGFDRPVLQGSNHVAGDVHVNGTVSANALTVEDTGLVSGLNADRLDGMHADDFLGATEKAADSELLDGNDSSDFLLDAPGSVGPSNLETIAAARVTGSNSIDSGGSDKELTFSSVQYDTAGMFDGANPERLTAPIAGIYQVQAGIRWQADGTGIRGLYLEVNDGPNISLVEQNPTGVAGAGQNVAATLSLSAGDYVEAQVYQNSGSTLTTVSNYTFLELVWVGPNDGTGAFSATSSTSPGSDTQGR